MQTNDYVLNDPEEINLVAIWLRKDTKRWVAGVMGGLFAGGVSLVVAMVISSIGGMEFWFPAKYFATIVSGPVATTLGAGFGSVILGAIVWEAVAAFFGFVFAHFTGVNDVGTLLAMGLVWSLFSWVFVWNLFLQSFRGIFWAHISSGAVFPVCLAYGLSLASVSMFDRMIRGSSAKR
ncbi:MAG: hypothetical protein ACXVBW_11765 [Bdellovibrionota bacterium]